MYCALKTDISEIEALKQANQVRRRQHDLAGRAGLTGPRWAILTELVRADGEGTATSISEGLGTSRQAVQRILGEMAEKGLVIMRRSQTDRRRCLVSISPAGRQLLEGLREADRPAEAAVVTELDARAAGGASGLLPCPVGEWLSGRGESQPQRGFEMMRNHILQQIRAGRLAPGDKLPPERELGVRFGIGRPAVREALRSLEMAGVVKILRGPHGGAFVRESGSDGIRDSIDAMLVVGRLTLHDLMEMRSMLLAQSVHLGAQRATQQDFDLIEDSINRLEVAAALPDQLTAIQPATDFYRLTARASRNPLLVLIMDALAALVGRMLASLGTWPRIDAVTPRRDVLRAMREGRAAEAAHLIQEHADLSKAVLKPYEDRLR